MKKIKKNMYLVDIIKIFKNKNYKIKNYQIDVNKRIGFSRVGRDFLVNLKILSLIKLIF